MSATKERARLWRYEIDEVDGDVPVAVGQVIVDKWKGNRTWTVYNFSQAGDPFVGYWHAKLLGEADSELTEQVYARWAAEAEARKAPAPSITQEGQRDD